MNAPSLLRAELKARNLTRTALAGELGVSKALVSMWLSRKPELKRRPGLATAFEIERWTEGRIPASAWVVGGRTRRGSSNLPDCV
jgi:transcriptional regulator with XRE-family HTH domain